MAATINDLPLRPLRQPSCPPLHHQSSSGAFAQNWKTRSESTPRALCQLREQSNEAPQKFGRYRRISAGKWSITSPEPSHNLARSVSTIRPVALPGLRHSASAKQYKGLCKRPGNGNLTLDMIPCDDDSERENPPQAVPSPVLNYGRFALRSTSSVYSEGKRESASLAKGMELYSCASPPPPEGICLDMSELEQYSRGTFRISDLQSSSNRGDGVRGAAEDAASAVKGWEQSKVANELEDTATDKKEDRHSPRSLRRDLLKNHWSAEQTNGFDGTSEFARRDRLSALGNLRDEEPSDELKKDNFSVRRDSHDFRHGSKRGASGYYFTSESTDAHTTQSQPEFNSNKRKSSHFSLRSLSDSLAFKRPRLSLGKMARSIRKGVLRARDRLRRRNGNLYRRNFESWRRGFYAQRPVYETSLRKAHQCGAGRDALTTPTADNSERNWSSSTVFRGADVETQGPFLIKRKPVGEGTLH